MKTPDNTKIWTPSWKFLIITVLLGANIVLIRIIEALAKHSEILHELCMNSSNLPGGCLLCPNGWILHRDDCYYYSDVTDRTWNQSRDQCEKMGADLLVIKNQEQQEFIRRDLRQRGDDTYWIGLHHDGDGWRWVDGEHYNSGLIQIKTQSSERCVSMTKSDYYQENCRSTNRWICLKKAVRI
ncbi:killer cell lectin-like receptor subfamily B member 1B allele B isoform X3 [Bufo gargarizans]|uniref:killer cell lectin-like receptor subfamily B member 1B allele B isoform X3 n=1 Tax=Bufo gargarizans TaxID=30331 RepID=UPI001CF504F9|nr:killer cell lectin-like receptor subfamily B member 1B allele B isoform X3 [Bufo gargarizans]